MPIVLEKTRLVDGFSFGGNCNWALERDMTGNVAVYVGLTTNHGRQEICLPKANRAGHNAGPREPKSKWDRGFYPFIDLTSFMQPFITARKQADGPHMTSQLSDSSEPVTGLVPRG